MELVETVEVLELLMHASRFPYSCRDRATVLREFGTLKPLDKLAKLRDDWNELEGRSRIDKLAECFDHKFLINPGSTQMLLFHFSLS